MRAGIQSIPRGEVEAARSLGLNYLQTMRLIVLPQALSRMTPAIVSQLITLIKDTSLASILGAQELVGYGRSFFTFYSNLLETFFVLACIYFVICYSLSRVSRRLELRQPRGADRRHRRSRSAHRGGGRRSPADARLVAVAVGDLTRVRPARGVGARGTRAGRAS